MNMLMSPPADDSSNADRHASSHLMSRGIFIMLAVVVLSIVFFGPRLILYMMYRDKPLEVQLRAKNRFLGGILIFSGAMWLILHTIEYFRTPEASRKMTGEDIVHYVSSCVTIGVGIYRWNATGVYWW